MSRFSRASLLSATLLSISALANAHHSSSPHFDNTKPLALQGVVTKLALVNPHAYLYFDVTGANGSVEHWNCEMPAAAGLRRNGLTTDVFKPGAVVSINAIAARRDPNGCSFVSGDLKDGTHIDRNGLVTKGTAAPKQQQVAAVPVVPVGQATLYGNWVTSARGGGPPGGDSRGGGAPAAGQPGGAFERFAGLMTDAGKAAASKYDDRFDDPALRCSPSSILRGWSEPGSFSSIARKGDTITIKHEYMDTVRTVDLRSRTHPAKIKSSLTGHSVGWFEGPTLVIDTVGFLPGVLLPHPGVLNSADMHMVERLSLSADGTQLINKYEVTDPQFLKAPLTGTNSWTRSSIGVSKYNCTELSGVNNRRPTPAK